jgi:hypothetical protein
MRNDSIVSELRQARPSAPTKVEPPLEVCERILATTPSAVRRRERRPRPAWRAWSARTLVLAAGLLTLTGAATAATIIAVTAPTPNGQEVMGPTGYVAYWQHGKLTRITECAKTPGAMECRGDRDQQRATEMRIQNETMRAITTGRDRGAAVLFLHAGGGELGCAGARACSYMGGERNSGKPLPRIGASE